MPTSLAWNAERHPDQLYTHCGPYKGANYNFFDLHIFAKCWLTLRILSPLENMQKCWPIYTYNATQLNRTVGQDINKFL